MHMFQNLLEGGHVKGLAESAPVLLEGLRVGIPQEHHMEAMHHEVLEAWTRAAVLLACQGAEAVPISVPHKELALPTYYLIAIPEAASNFVSYDSLGYGFSGMSVESAADAADPKIPQDLHNTLVSALTTAFGEELRGRLLQGTFAMSENAAAYHTKVHILVLDNFQSVDVVLAPTIASAAPTAEEAADMGVVESYAADSMTVPAILSGLPAMSVSVARSRASGLPIGLHLVRRYGSEVSLLKPGRVLEVLRSEILGELVSPFEMEHDVDM